MMILLGGLMITLPAVIVVLLFIGRPMMIPALVSLAVNSLPFIAAYWLLRKQNKKGGGIDLEH